MKNLAVIFDMDGVIIDNTKYHILAWQKQTKDLGKPVSAKTVREKFMGRFGREIMRDLLGKDVSNEELEKRDAQRETYYRKIYAKAIKPVKGLVNFLESLKRNKIKIAIATAAPPQNVKFVLRKTGLKKYFRVIVDARGVKRGKPNPDIYLKAAKLIHTKPQSCIVFEDAMTSIAAARRAGMKVVGVATTHKIKQLAHTDLVVKDFSQISVNKLLKLF